MLDTMQLGLRLRSARERRGLSQQAVAAALNLQRTAVTNIESGNRAVSTLELSRLAELYGCKPATFLDAAETVDDTPVIRLRALYQGQLPDDFTQTIDRVRELCREGAELRRMLEPGFTENLANYASVLRSGKDAIQQGYNIAREERRRLGLGNAPIGNIAGLISSQGIWVAAYSFPDNLSGMLLNDRTTGVVILINGNHFPVRRTFSYAHEYGHALCDRGDTERVSQGGSDLVEMRANAFASAFLMPAGGVEDQLRRLDKGKPSRQAQIVYDVAGNTENEVEIRPPAGSQAITYQDVAVIARHFGVSYEAAIWRLKNLGHLDVPETKELIAQREAGKGFMNLLKFTDTFAETGVPDEERDQELRSQLMWLAVEAYRREEISQGRLRELAGKLMVSATELIKLAEAARAN
ncbi:ImmA/IrrE family metallo-endopeptidase [Telmatospirillum sp.]|uniref:ImmA/IrrE family metallo-endopeptidase n=1 Tax=Telmatospirillum sp. TaxID=2079197 RepID=UPI00284E6FC5|nr:ImmA/IrrE family metallo-endopeptidase [Telmatospirillum sp.]MDR3440590.1 ImmA/IrrE family metallo-endopeptidase [Telmatospirillum sp.]